MITKLDISDLTAELFSCKGLKLQTQGGMWSDHKTTVRIKSIEFRAADFILETKYFCNEIRVYFDRRDWDINKHGLIYTDNLFLQELRDFIGSNIATKFACKSKKKNIERELDYTEQGMQGENFVSLEADWALASLLLKEALLQFATKGKRR